MSWSWSFIPQRLMADERFLELTMADRGLLFSLYHRCDKWGRGPGNARALTTLVGSLDVREIGAGLERLFVSGLVLRVGGDWELDRYDEDAKSVGILKRRSSPSDYGNGPVGPTAPDAAPQPSDNVRQRPTVSDDAGQRPPTSVPDETRRDETRVCADAHTVRARVYEPSAPMEEPDQRVVAATERWLAHHDRVRPTAMTDPASVATVARDFAPEVFERGVEHHLGEGPAYWTKQPLRYLRIRCEWARDKPPPKAREPTAAVSAPRRKGKTLDELTPGELAELGLEASHA